MCDLINETGPRIVAAATEPSDTFSEKKPWVKYSTSYFVAVDDNKRNIIIAFTGTDPPNKEDATRNIRAFKLKKWGVPGCSSCQVSSSYAGAWEDVRNDVYTAIQRQSIQGYRLIFVGHSAGAAIATIAAGDARTSPQLSKYDIDLVGSTL